MSEPHFEVIRIPFVNKLGTHVYYQFIVLVDNDGMKHFTDYGNFVNNPRSEINKLNDDGNNRFAFVRMLLQYVFFTEGIRSLSELRIEHVIAFFDKYHTCTLPFDTGRNRSAATMKRCRNVIMDFLENLIEADKISIKVSELYKTISVMGKHRRMVKRRVPVFDIAAAPTPSPPLFRDIPSDAFDILFSHIRQNHPDLLGLIACSAFAGLRPSEACNVRRPDSTLYGPGIRFVFEYSDRPSRIEIDLSKERKLRSDNAYIGKIKKERYQLVPELFKKAFYAAYEEYMEYTSTMKREPEYGPLNINRSGKCYTYKSYADTFNTIVKDELIPIYLASYDPEIVSYGRLLVEYDLSPHVFRHWYTVQLVLAGMDNPAELMVARGDTSPESALTYIQNKSELEKQYRKVNDEMFDYFMWAGKKLNEGN